MRNIKWIRITREYTQLKVQMDTGISQSTLSKYERGDMLPTAENLLVSTVSGEANVDGSAMRAEVTSMSGDVTVDGVFEALQLKSTSGDAEFTGSVTDLTVSSVS